MERTENKINEARYFLDQTKNYERGDIEFLYNLEAFIAFARSMFHVLNKEITDIARNYKKRQEEEKHRQLLNWLKKKEEDMHKDPICSFFIEKRNFILKQGFTEIKGEMDFPELVKVLNEILLERRDEHGQLINTKSSEASIEELLSISRTDASVRWTFKDWQGNEDLFTLCLQYISKLEKLTIEAKKLLMNL